MLQANHESNADYVNYFEPIVDNAIQQMAKEYVIDSDVSDFVYANFQIRIPPSVVRLITLRLYKKKYLKLVNGKYVLEDTVRPYDFDASLRQSKATSKSTVSNIQLYASEKLEMKFARSEYETALCDFLKEFSVEILNNHYSNKSNIICKDTINYFLQYRRM